jgi:hypothetical protein
VKRDIWLTSPANINIEDHRKEVFSMKGDCFDADNDGRVFAERKSGEGNVAKIAAFLHSFF